MTELLLKPAANLIELTADVVTAYVSNNPVPAAELPGLIAQIHSSISRLRAQPEPKQELTPRVPIKKTITADYIISLEDGKQYRTLKRHLSNFGLTPDDYRAKWSLPADYPMVAPAYSARRSELAKNLGLGRRPAAKPATKQVKRTPSAKSQSAQNRTVASGGKA
ncbi:MucR family transcriptional regulator [Aminobacter aminovorans]|uniref:MucR family transcriptional regulator n=1 Tax=Aminobacter aminovorans TaxID=83263 RepID=UPI002859FF23|nr:MucR family transcriptional regulator [Aminobacter aminovorans]MDR7221672.1 putative transcriptional regulator [Aminobacter aminovorans]